MQDDPESAMEDKQGDNENIRCKKSTKDKKIQQYVDLKIHGDGH